MSLTIEQIARAFSDHRFDAVIPYLSDTVCWEILGGDTVTGKEAVAANCHSLTDALADVGTEFSFVRTVVGDNCVVVDSTAEYTDPAGGRSLVASCDIFQFDNHLVTTIRSYNVELG